ncbi:MAG: DUF6768 family protein [Allosphingosinicella sp.]|uniref:DUF6768 family protein n=1 Tax=Allosphingosinicella sp. TaxID=2823234 RepID=UPI003952E4FA
MRDLDRMIDEALDQEERELLARIGPEPGFFGQAFGLFGGRLGWVNALMMAVQAALFLGGVYAAFMFFDAAEPVAQLRWGLPAAVLLILSLMIKLSLWPQIHADRLMRELKRIELQLARRG